jgi:hypothetical protein
MKNLIVMALGCMTVILGSCSSSLKGGYVGRATISTIDSANQYRTEIGENVFALVTEESDMRTVDFSQTDLIRNCKLQVESRSKNGDLNSPQPCEVTVNGNTELLKVDELRFTSASGVGPGGIIISIRGRSNEGKNSVSITFTGLPKK